MDPTASLSQVAGPSSTPHKASLARWKVGAIVGGVLGGILIITMLVVLSILYRRKKRKSKMAPSAEFLAYAARNAALLPTSKESRDLRNASNDSLPPFSRSKMSDPFVGRPSLSRESTIAYGLAM